MILIGTLEFCNEHARAVRKSFPFAYGSNYEQVLTLYVYIINNITLYHHKQFICCKEYTCDIRFQSTFAFSNHTSQNISSAHTKQTRTSSNKYIWCFLFIGLLEVFFAFCLFHSLDVRFANISTDNEYQLVSFTYAFWSILQCLLFIHTLPSFWVRSSLFEVFHFQSRWEFR